MTENNEPRMGLAGLTTSDVGVIARSKKLRKLFWFIFCLVIYTLIVLLFVPPVLISFYEGSQMLNTPASYTAGIFLIIAGFFILFSSIGFLHYIRTGLFYPAIYPSNSQPMTVIIILSILYIFGLFITACIMWSNWTTSVKCSVTLNGSLQNIGTEDPLIYADEQIYDKERIISICGTSLFWGFIMLIIGIFVSSYILNKKRDKIISDVIQIFSNNKDQCSSGDCKLDFGGIVNQFGQPLHDYINNMGIKHSVPMLIP